MGGTEQPQTGVEHFVGLQGSAEAICASLEALGSDIVTVKAVPVGLGPLSTADIEMAVSTGAHVVGFNIKPSNAAVDAQAKQKNVPILRHNIIYHLLQEVSPHPSSLLPHLPEAGVY
jgi:translation initiation factor IF-2